MNKQALIERYEQMVESKQPGSGKSASTVVLKYWDAKSDALLEKEMLPRHAISDSVVMSVLRDLAVRFPQMNQEIKNLKK